MSVFKKVVPPCIHAVIFHKTPLVIPVLKLTLKNITIVLNHIENSAFRLPISGYPTISIAVLWLLPNMHSSGACLVPLKSMQVAGYIPATKIHGRQRSREFCWLH